LAFLRGFELFCKDFIKNVDFAKQNPEGFLKLFIALAVFWGFLRFLEVFEVLGGRRGLAGFGGVWRGLEKVEGDSEGSERWLMISERFGWFCWIESF
jgi:hypothetical protein